MSLSRQPAENLDLAPAALVGKAERWLPGSLDMHCHRKHQLMFAISGVLHLTTSAGQWVLPPSRAVWIRAGVEHSVTVKRPCQTRVLYIDPAAFDLPDAGQCMVFDVTPLVRELITACAALPRDYGEDSAEARLAQVLIDQIRFLDHAPTELLMLADARAVRVVDILRADPGNRQSLAELASRAGASVRTLERVFAREAHMSFGAWRQRHRLLVAMEQLAYGASVTNVALEVGYESPSSFIAAFKAMFGATPARYFKSAGAE